MPLHRLADRTAGADRRDRDFNYRHPFWFYGAYRSTEPERNAIRNGIVLVEEIEQQNRKNRSTGRLSMRQPRAYAPILLTAFTTVLGLAPALLDVFFRVWRWLIMFGLGFATLLTLLVLPVVTPVST